MSQPFWTDVLSAIGAVLTPIIVLILGIHLSHKQSRSDELLRLRIDYYRQLAPELNRLMCYMTFIGTWRDDSPEEIVDLKRRMDRLFFTAAPLFSDAVGIAYKELMEVSFSTFGAWGVDAKILTNAYRRRTAWRGSQSWKPEWDSIFALPDTQVVSEQDLHSYKARYDVLLKRLVNDLNINRARVRYTTNAVVKNAHNPGDADKSSRS